MALIIKYWYISVIAILLAGWGYTYTSLTSKYTKLHTDTLKAHSAALDLKAKELERSIKYSKELQANYEKETESLNEKLQILDSRYKSNQSELIGLHQVLYSTRANASSYPASTTLELNNTLTELLGEFTTLATESSEQADKATTLALYYHSLLVKQKDILEQYNSGLQSNVRETSSPNTY